MTRSMTRWVLTGFMALAAVAVLDVGSSTAQAEPSVNPFAGSWSGTWSVAERGVDGTYDWTISDAGQIKGTVYNATLDSGGTVVGHVAADGKLKIVGYAPNDVPGTGFNGFPFQGTAVLDGDDKFVVSAIGLGDSPSERPSLVATLERN